MLLHEWPFENEGIAVHRQSLFGDESQVIADYSIVVPCYNERGAITETVVGLRRSLGSRDAYQLIIVDDGSNDGTSNILAHIKELDPDLVVLRHERNRGYGASLKTGIRHARGDIIVITDADGTYPNDRIPELVNLCKTYAMAVGSRTGTDVTYSRIRRIPKVFLGAYCSWIAGQRIPDINSGLRAFRKSVAMQYFHILPNGFSFTTTITLAMLTNYYPVYYVPIDYASRVGQSKIKAIRDTLRFLKLIIRTGTYFAPLRVFAPVVMLLFTLFGGSLTYDVIVLGNITDKTILFLLFAMNTGMFALLADMIDKRTGR
jgi:glycosyltransferase involved in cell wall biosynthesis